VHVEKAEKQNAKSEKTQRSWLCKKGVHWRRLPAGFSLFMCMNW
jgi:hypothetical protein